MLEFLIHISLFLHMGKSTSSAEALYLSIISF